MIDLTGTNAVPENRTAVAMGLFDGLHIGHRAVIGKAPELASEGVCPAVFTFDTASVSPKGGEYILSRELKFERMEQLGIKYIYSPEFSELKDMDGEEFVRRVLCEKLCARYAVCGEDFRFGKGAAWGAEELETLCKKRDIRLYVVPTATDTDGRKISSTLIRELLRDGKISRAGELMGLDFALKLPVAEGNRIGRTLDFPTINQHIPEGQFLPKFGVYASKTEYGGKLYRSVTNIGVKPTVGSSTPLAETYIMDYDGGELYGETVKVSLIRFIRPERKFGSIEKLKEQIAKDIREAKAVGSSHQD